MRWENYLVVLASMAVVCACGKEESPDKKTDPADKASGSIKDKVDKEIEKVAPAAIGKGADSTDFGVESAKIVFKSTGMEEGTITVWIAEYGKTVVMFSDMTKPMAEKRHTVWKNAETTMWSDTKKPSTMKIRPKDTELRLVSTNDPKQFEMAGYEKRPNEEIAGQDCEVWHHPTTNVTLWRWKGIDLKSINGIIKKNPPTMEAIEVVIPAEIPADMMTPPKP